MDDRLASDVSAPASSPDRHESAIPVTVPDGAAFDLLCVAPAAPHRLLYWLPAMGMPARHYLPFARELAARGTGVLLHEWRGIGSSNRRAGRQCDWGYRALLQDDLPAGMAVLRRRWPGVPCSVGGHSLGGQLGPILAALHPGTFDSLVLVASGAPYWRGYRRGGLIALGLILARLLARAWGCLPGRRLGFAGNEARGVIADWARSGRSGKYSASGLERDLEQALAVLRVPVLALCLRDDWLAPGAALDWLLAKLGPAPCTRACLTTEDLGGRPADHFGWMEAPAPVALRVADWLGALDAP